MLGSLRVGSIVYHSGARFVAGKSSGGYRRTRAKLACLVLFLFLFVFFFARVDAADLEREDREVEAETAVCEDTYLFFSCTQSI